MNNKAVTHAPHRKNIWAGRMMRIKKASRAHCSGVKPGATACASQGARAMPPRVSRVEAAAIQQKTQEKKRQASASSS